MKSKILFIDVDGVLVDYNEAYARHYNTFFGEDKQLVDNEAYGFMKAYNIPELHPKDLAALYEARGEEFWETMRPKEGAYKFLKGVSDNGWHVVAISKADYSIAKYRYNNLRGLYGAFIDNVICTGNESKSTFINNIFADKKVFIDDYWKYFNNVDRHTWKILFNRNNKSDDNPNNGNFINVNQVIMDNEYPLGLLERM